MYNYEDILARLRKGEAADNIVKEFTDALNAAEKAQKEDVIQEQKVADFKDLTLQTLEFFQKYYPEVGFGEVEISDETAATMLKSLESEMQMLAALTPLALIGGKSKIPTRAKDPIADFLDKFVN